MTENFVTFDQAYKLKQLGFNWECNHIYKNKEHTFFHCLQDAYDNHNAFTKKTTDDLVVSAPTLAQAAKWLREVKDICVTSLIKIHKGQYKFAWDITLFKEDRGIWDENLIYDQYEEALSAGISRAMELITKEKE